MTLGGRLQESPDGDDDDTDRVTVPEKPFTAPTVMVDVPEAPARTCAGPTVPAEMEKSWPVAAVTWKVRVAVG